MEFARYAPAPAEISTELIENFLKSQGTKS
jgi:hypothetical protein